jgi:probable F420-dependent oxidoreductase
VRIGLSTFCTDQTIDPGELAREAEERGFGCLFLTDHTHIPVSHDPKSREGEPLPEYYKRTHDPFVALSFAAGATTTLGIGTGICLVAQRDPIVTAKQVASLDRLSGGRVTFGVGFGWNRDELRSHGVSFKDRREITRERVSMMKRLWTQDVAEFDGTFEHLVASWAWPKPSQKPHPRIYLGGGGPVTMHHAAEWADAWFPTFKPDDETMERSIATFRAVLEDVGRDPATVGIAISSAPGDARVLERYREQGVECVTLRVPPVAPSAVLRELDRLADVLTSLV